MLPLRQTSPSRILIHQPIWTSGPAPGQTRRSNSSRLEAQLLGRTGRPTNGVLSRKISDIAFHLTVISFPGQLHMTGSQHRMPAILVRITYVTLELSATVKQTIRSQSKVRWLMSHRGMAVVFVFLMEIMLCHRRSHCRPQ